MKNTFKIKDYVLLITSILALIFLIVDISIKGSQWNNEYQNTLNEGAKSYLATFKWFYSLMQFTYLSNLMLAISCIMFIFLKDKKWVRYLLFNALVYMTITFFVYWILISWNSNAWSNPYYALSSVITHFLLFVNGVIVVILNSNWFKISKFDSLITAAPFALYYFFALILFFSTSPHAVIYSFLDFKKPMFMGTSMIAVIFGNILIIILLPSIPIGFAFAWRAIIEKTNIKNNKLN